VISPSGYCGHCRNCRRGEFVHCEVGMVTGATSPGGYADYVMAPASALARNPFQAEPSALQLLWAVAAEL
jgi:D-arabinose 1-dehydrogenase-like Zn-dependent alcohol dehydrogenase